MEANPTDTSVPEARARTLWAKSSGGTLPLLEHMYDTVAAGELVWQHYVSDGLRNRLDTGLGGRGRDVFRFLCATHDVGKATPLFQMKGNGLTEAISRAGLSLSLGVRRGGVPNNSEWHHTIAGAAILQTWLPEYEWPTDVITWVRQLVAAHHGNLPTDPNPIRIARKHTHRPLHQSTDPGPWNEVQGWLAAHALEIASLRDVALPPFTPARGDLLALSGLLIMADWVASNGEVVRRSIAATRDPVPSIRSRLMSARERVAEAWRALDLGEDAHFTPTGGAEATDAEPIDAVSIHYQKRFGIEPWPAQRLVAEAADNMQAPGILIVEARMGDGKTEASMIATEILAQRFGLHGLFIALPTQATTDAMFERTAHWASQAAPNARLNLLHGKGAFNPLWQRIQRERAAVGIDQGEVDEYGLADEFLSSPAGSSGAVTNSVPTDWFAARNRGLLPSITVGTLDQLLRSAVRAPHVALRHAGLSNKVIVIDEAHSSSAYMNEFLHAALYWLGSMKVPVIVMSATLAPSIRRDFVIHYLSGASPAADRAEVTERVEDAIGYPLVVAAAPSIDGTDVDLTVQGLPEGNGAEAGRPQQRIAIEVIPDELNDLVGRLEEALATGGVALVLRNTVRRAQDAFDALRERFGQDVFLMHSQFTVADRADRTEAELNQLGPKAAKSERRPQRHILVATQVVEQSFDIDVDLLVSDIAPIDMIFQRSGRLHRHSNVRPAPLATPRMLITGVKTAHIHDIESAAAAGDEHLFAAGFDSIYSRHLLLRTLAVVNEALEHGFVVPDDIPTQVARVYAEEFQGPEGWSASLSDARQLFRPEQEERIVKPAEFILGHGIDLQSREALTLEGLGKRKTDGTENDLDVLVRDGEPSQEVLLLSVQGDGHTTADGKVVLYRDALVADRNLAQALAGSMIRLPSDRRRFAKVIAALSPLPSALTDHPVVRWTKCLELDREGFVKANGVAVARYSTDMGFEVL